MRWLDLGFGPAGMVTNRQIAGATTLLQELLDHAQRDFETLSDLLLGGRPAIASGHNSFS